MHCSVTVCEKWEVEKGPLHLLVGVYMETLVMKVGESWTLMASSVQGSGMAAHLQGSNKRTQNQEEASHNSVCLVLLCRDVLYTELKSWVFYWGSLFKSLLWTHLQSVWRYTDYDHMTMYLKTAFLDIYKKKKINPSKHFPNHPSCCGGAGAYTKLQNIIYNASHPFSVESLKSSHKPSKDFERRREDVSSK